MITYQLSNGKTVYLTIEEYLDLSDLDIQYLISLNIGDTILDPFKGSAVEKNTKEKFYDFDYLPDDEGDHNNIISDEDDFDDIIDLSDNVDM
jgi:hypothetical protein